MNYLLSCELYAVVGHRAILLVWMWLSAIVPLYLMQVLKISSCRGGAAKISTWHYYVHFLAGETHKDRPWLVTLPDSKVRHDTPLFSFDVRISRNLVRRLPFERDTVGGMQIFAYLWPYLFWIVHAFWTARRCVDGLVPMFYSGPRQSFGITSLLFSGYALFFGRTCIWRTAGRCC